jgi:hypothetical protein
MAHFPVSLKFGHDLDISSRRRNKPLAHAPIRTTGQAPKSVLNPGRRPLQFREF